LTRDRKQAYKEYVEDLLLRHELRHPDGRRLRLYGAYDGTPLPEELPPEEQQALHLRHDALTDRWIAISPARNTRPQTRTQDGTPPACPLCVGGPEVPFPYEAAVFDNRFPTLLRDAPPPPALEGPTAPSRGVCEVVLYTPTHTGSLATLTSQELARVIAIWTDRSAALFADPELPYVLAFENRGEDVGATLSHPHGQIYTLDHIPPFAAARVRAISAHREAEDRCLTCTVVERDDVAEARTVAMNPSFTVAVPFAPNWPYEVHVRARRHGARRLVDLTVDERRDLASALRDVVRRYDRLHEHAPLAYMMVCQQAPTCADGAPLADWHLSFEFLPPNRAPDKLKVRASVETAAGFFINDTVPEESAALLAAVVTDPVPDDFPDVRVVPASHAHQTPSP
jgi:UDPglucose--hexose-1-phosphate uridylyltransferase